MSNNDLPVAGTKLKCINNTDRPELQLEKVYVVITEPFLDKMPMNEKRFQPDDFRFVAIQLTNKERGVFPIGIFSVVK